VVVEALVDGDVAPAELRRLSQDDRLTDVRVTVDGRLLTTSFTLEAVQATTAATQGTLAWRRSAEAAELERALVVGLTVRSEDFGAPPPPSPRS
jgi:hypothetical protein